MQSLFKPEPALSFTTLICCHTHSVPIIVMCRSSSQRLQPMLLCLSWESMRRSMRAAAWTLSQMLPVQPTAWRHWLRYLAVWLFAITCFCKLQTSTSFCCDCSLFILLCTAVAVPQSFLSSQLRDTTSVIVVMMMSCIPAVSCFPL